MAKQLFLNNFESTFIANVKDAPTTGTPATELGYGILQLNSGAAAALVNPTGGDHYIITAYKRSGSVESNVEIMHVLEVDNTTINECRIRVSRGQEGTPAQAYVPGDYVALRLTKGGADNFLQDGDSRLNGVYEPAFSAGTTSQFLRGDKTWQEIPLPGNATTSADGFMSSADKTKLDGVATAATANSSDATLLDRANHTGTQAISTVDGLQTAIDAKLAIGQYGFGSLTLPFMPGANLNTLESRAMRFMSNNFVNAPRGSAEWFLVEQLAHNDLWIVQIAYGMTNYMSGSIFQRWKNAGTWGEWKNISVHREYAINLTGTTLDFTAGTDFYKTISANTTITLSNASAATGLAQAVSLIINHTGGTISFTGATIKWAGGSAPTLTTSRVHQFYFWPDPITNQVLVSVVSYY